MHHPGAPISWDPAKVLQMVNSACDKRTCPAITQQKHRCTIPGTPPRPLQAVPPQGPVMREYAVGNWKKLIKDWFRAQDQPMNRSALAGVRSVGRDDERYDGDDSDSHGGGYAHSAVPRSVHSPSQRVSRSSILKSEPVAPAPAPVVKAEAAPAVKNEDASFPAIKEEPRDFSHNVFDELTASSQRGREQQEQSPTMKELLRQLREMTIRVDTVEEENAALRQKKTALRQENSRFVRRQQELEDQIEEQFEEINWLRRKQSDCED